MKCGLRTYMALIMIIGLLSMYGFGDTNAYQTDTELDSTENFRFSMLNSSHTTGTPFSRMDLSPDGDMLAVGKFQKIVLLSPITMEVIKELSTTEITYGYNVVKFSADGSFLVAGGDDAVVDIWDLSDDSMERLVGQGGDVTRVEFSKNGEVLATLNSANEVHLWDMETLEFIRTLYYDIGVVRDLSFSPDGRVLAVGGSGERVTLWNMSTYQVIVTLNGPQGDVSSLEYSLDGRYLYFGLKSGELKRWTVTYEISGPPSIGTVITHSPSINFFVFSSDEDLIITGSSQGDICFWDKASKTLLKTIIVSDTDSIEYIAFAEDRYVAVSILDEAITVLDFYSSDFDEDGLTYGDEMDYNTDPNNPDTDADRMEDGWEVENGLDPLVNDQDLDADNDGYRNLDEYERGTDPQNPDTDGDGYSDGEEIRRGDPLDPNRTPLTDTLQIVAIVGLVLLIIVAWFVSRKMKERKKIRDLGFTSTEDLENAQEMGFASAIEMEEALKAGCLYGDVYDKIHEYGYNSVNEMVSSWYNSIEKLDILNSIDLSEYDRAISESKSPSELLEMGDRLKSDLLDPVASIIPQIAKSLNQMSSFKRMAEFDEIFVNLTIKEVEEKQITMSTRLEQLKEKRAISSRIEERIDWFRPYQNILEVMQQTEAGIPVQLSRIAQLAQTDNEHAEGIIKFVLQSRPEIGRFLELEQVYIRGEDIGSAIDDLLDDFAKFEEKRVGKS